MNTVEELVQAAIGGDTQQVIQLLKKGVTINAKTGLHENTALHHVCETTADVEMMKLLISKGAKPRSENAFQDTPLHLLCRNPNITLEAANVLLYNGAHVNSLNWRARNVAHTYFYCQKTANLDIVKTLVEHGVNLNSRCEGDMNVKLLNGNTAFCYHIDNQEALNYEVVEFLLEKNANPNARGDAKYTPLHLLCRHGGERVDIAELLIQKGANVDIRAKDDYTPLHVLCGISPKINLQMLKFLLSCGANPGAQTGDFGLFPPLPSYTALHLVCRRKEIDVHAIRMLLLFGAYINSELPASTSNEKCAYTPLHLLFLYHTAPTNIPALKLLLESGAKPNAKCLMKETALHLACNDDTITPECVKILLQYKADVNARGRNARTPLHVLCQNKNINLEILKLLLDHKAMVNATAKSSIQANHTPLHFLCANEFAPLEAMGMLLKHGANVNAYGELKFYPLHFYCKNPSVTFEGIDLLLSNKAFINPSAWDGLTPLHLLVKNKEADPDLVKFMVSKGANANAKTTEGAGRETPLHLAVTKQMPKMVRALLEAGADPSQSNAEGKTVWEIADDEDVREVLEEFLCQPQ